MGSIRELWLEWCPEPRRVSQGKVTAPSLVYEGQQESLYFQAEPPQQFNVQQELEKPPVSCLLKPIHPGHYLDAMVPLSTSWSRAGSGSGSLD